ncbi:hypothetical protein Ddye_009481 [Dipteronia dyeriana]|uniref:Uncharacterized protein n=1 Tax=Dipteronia dyeriana TaxID=168575 RepID=A0AAD9XBL3_9ROSI|nr:hypothetical protein Ddye_009481 [Dipteronia dyeriana]
MSSRRGGGKPFATGASNSQSSKAKNVSEISNPQVEQLAHSVTDFSLDSAQDDGGWEVYAKKSKNRAGNSAAKPWGSQNPSNIARGHPDAAQKQGMRGNNVSGRASGSTWPGQTADSRIPAGRGNARPQLTSKGTEKNYIVPQPGIRPPLEHGWNWQSRAGSSQSKGSEEFQKKDNSDVEDHKDRVGSDDYDDENGDDSDAADDSDDELLSDDFDSDTSQKSLETRKRSRWFIKFFESLDSLSVEEINEPARQWHCPACQGGPGAIDWYRGLQPLMTHAKTKGAKRVKLHRELAELLDEDLRRRGTSVIPPGEMFGKWKGLKEEEKDHEIVWPPMVIIMNTKHDKDENDKWIGMGNQELLDYFEPYNAVKARHSYGPQGHRGMSVLIFESSARGYLEAERLHKHFVEQGTDRSVWDRHKRVLFHSGGKRQLYGYMAVKEDMDSFNQHSQGKAKLKFEMRSYQEMVVNQIKQMSEDNQQLVYFKNRVVKEQKHTKALEESFQFMSEKLRKTMEENRIVRQRTKMQHEQNMEEMNYQEEFFKDRIKMIHEARNEKEEDFEKLQQLERNKVKQSIANTSSNAEYLQRAEEKIEKFIESQEKEVEEYANERDNLIKAQEERKCAMRQRHHEEEVALEVEFSKELDQLMSKYSPHHSDNATNTNL